MLCDSTCVRMLERSVRDGRFPPGKPPLLCPAWKEVRPMLRLRLSVSKGLFLGVGILSAAIGAYGTTLIQQAEATKDWPTTQGKIIVSEIRPGKDDGSSRPLVRFQYGLRGTIYRSEQYRQNTAGESMKKTAAEELIRKYQVGAPVRVYYNPENPMLAVLE